MNAHEPSDQAGAERRKAGGNVDPLLSALAALPCANPDSVHAQALIARATQTMARRRSFAERRTALFAGVYQAVEPVAACLLSAAFLAGVFGQAFFVLAQANATFLWR